MLKLELEAQSWSELYQLLAQVLRGGPAAEPGATGSSSGQSGPEATPAPMRPVPGVPLAPATPVQTPAPASAPAVAPSPVPLASPAVYTAEQVSRAGADLLAQNPGKMPELLGLLGQFGVQAVTELKPEHLGAFATALRGLGAKL